MVAGAQGVTSPIRSARVSSYLVPTASPEQDGTLEWDSTTILVVQLQADRATGLGYGYADLATAHLLEKSLLPLLAGASAFDVCGLHQTMTTKIRNLGRPGIASMAISITDTALWDLKSRLLNVSLADLLGRCRERVIAYGSGGFTNYTDQQLAAQVNDWLDQGLHHFKIKVGRDHRQDIERVRLVRSQIGRDDHLFVDANAAYHPAMAIKCAGDFARFDVTWFEEPVSSDDLEGLRRVRDHAPLGIDIAAGEYGYTPFYFREMLAAGAVDVLQADATRCGGVTGILTAGAICEAFQMPLSAHTAPTIHAHAGVSIKPMIHVEYFSDHARIESLFFDGAIEPKAGMLEPSRDRPGLGITLKCPDVERWLQYQSG